MLRLTGTIAGAVAALFWAGAVCAQTPGAVRAQGQAVEPAPAAPAAPAGPGAGLRDLREDMRSFVQTIAAFAHQKNRQFAVVAMGGLGLINRQAEPGNDEKQVPSRGYLRSIDGLLVEAPSFGPDKPNEAVAKDRQDRIFAQVDVALANRLPVLSLDYATEPKLIDQAYQVAQRKRIVPYVAPAVGMMINRLSALPSRPLDANPNNILSIRDIRNFAMIRDSSGFGSQVAFALQMHDTNFDALIVDVFHKEGEPLTKRAVETMKYKKLGARRLVLAYLNIGEAESFRYYWKPGWREGSPAWIAAPYPGDPEKFFAEYWNPAWQAIITGDATSYLYGVIDQGFDGVVLDGLDAYLYFEGGAETYLAGR